MKRLASPRRTKTSSASPSGTVGLARHADDDLLAVPLSLRQLNLLKRLSLVRGISLVWLQPATRSRLRSPRC
jgi:hypothetical protein